MLKDHHDLKMFYNVQSKCSHTMFKPIGKKKRSHTSSGRKGGLKQKIGKQGDSNGGEARRRGIQKAETAPATSGREG